MTARTDLDRYLRRATWGLWGAQRQQVRDELEEHLLERASGLQVLGLGEHEAMTRALRELGPPERISSGMTGVYAMPTLIKTSALSALLLTLGFGALTDSGAQVSAVTERPSTPTCAKASQGMKEHPGLRIVSQQGNLYCYVFTEVGAYAGTYLNLNSLESVLREKGVTVRQADGRTELGFPGASGPARPRVAFTTGGQRYIDLRETAYNFGLLGLPVTLQGWTNPTIQVGQVAFTVGTPAMPVSGEAAYQVLMMEIRDELLPRGGTSLPCKLPSCTAHKHRVQVDAPAGTVIGLLSRNERGVPWIDVAPVGQDGSVTLQAPWPKLSLVTDPQALSPYQAGGRANALLVRLTGVVSSGKAGRAGQSTLGSRYAVLRPARSTSDSTP